jgi:hypothetical protein
MLQMSLKEKVKKNQSVKKFVHYLLIPKKQARPRTWVKWFVNPFYHTRKAGSLIRRSVRMDVVPFNPFEIGKDSVVEDFATINNGVGPVTIGDRVFIGLGNVIIGPVEIGNAECDQWIEPQLRRRPSAHQRPGGFHEKDSDPGELLDWGKRGGHSGSNHWQTLYRCRRLCGHQGYSSLFSGCGQSRPRGETIQL